MHYENRYQYVYFLLSGIVAGIIIILIYISVQGSDHRHRMVELKKIQNTLTFLKPEREWNYNNSWQYIGDPFYRHQIYSAYFDPRLELYHPKVFKEDHIYYGSVRVFAVLPLRLNGEIKCNYRYEDFFSDEYPAYEALPIHEHFNMKYSAYTIMCPLRVRRGAAIVHLPESVALIYSANPLSEQVPTYVPISYSKGDLLAKPDKKLALCIGPMHRNYGDVLRLVEFIEIYRLLGADQFYIYRLSVTPSIDAVLEHYRRDNIVKVNNWNFHGYAYESEIRYEGILAEFNECIYRATFVDGYKYVAVVDLDEILMPLRYNTLLDFLKVIEDGRTSGYVFRNVFFFKQGLNDTKATPARARNRFLYTQVKVKRTLLSLPPHDRSKCIVNGRNTIEMGNHEVWRSVEGTSETYVSYKEALLFHYRNVCSGCKVEPLIVDFTSRRFGSIIWSQVDDVCEKVFTNGVCPMG